MLKNFTKEEKSWILYDWANSVFATIMLAAIFPIFFVGVADAAGAVGSMWWGYGQSVSRFAAAVAAPFIGALIDYRNFKKRLFVGFLAGALVSTSLAAIGGQWQFLLLAYIFANMFFGMGNIVYDSFLHDVTTKDRMDKVSAAGFAWGYIGGSTIPFVISIAIIMFGHNFGIDEVLAVRLSVGMTAVWWGFFSIPIIKNVHHKYGKDRPERGLFGDTIKSVISTARKITKNKGLFMFIIAYFFYIDGVGTVISMATAYGAELGIDSTGMIIALFVTQLVAFPCSLLFGYLSKKTNSLNLIIGAIIVYFFICIVGFVMGFGIEEGLFDMDVALMIFWGLACLVGTVQGGIQAISRSTFARLVPPENSGEYFGFFDIFGRFASILGPLLYAITLGITGRGSVSMLSVIVMFAIGLIVLLMGRKHIQLT